jgi:hypothetical protein
VTGSPWSSNSGRSSDGSPDSVKSPAPQAGRLIEIVTVLLLGVATVGSAWSAFQVSRWNGVETDEARASAVFRIEGSREFALATQIVAYDSATVGQIAAATVTGNQELLDFLRATLVRPGFVPVLQSWQAQIDAGETPTNLLSDDDYLGDLFAASIAADAQAAAATVLSEEAGSNADDYIQLTLFFASALFFAGITASFANRLSKVTLLVGAGVILAVAGVLLAGYPVT